MGRINIEVRLDALLGSLNSDPVKKPTLLPMKVSPRIVTAL
jgi:hypothetical protein